jgi:hypothetical protein
LSLTDLSIFCPNVQNNCQIWLKQKQKYFLPFTLHK